MKRIMMISIAAIMVLCSALIVSATPCGQLIVEPQPGEWMINTYDFQYTEGNITSKICGNAPYSITNSKMGMWLEMTVFYAPVKLEVYAKINHTDTQGIVRPYYLNHTQYYAVGPSPVHLVSPIDNYYVGKYDVVEVGAKKI